MTVENCWWKSPWPWCWRRSRHRWRRAWTQMCCLEAGFPETGEYDDTLKDCTWGWCLMKLTGFLFYFCHIQISAALKDEAVRPKFILKNLKKKREEEKEIKCLSNTLFETTLVSTHFLSGTPRSWLRLLSSCFQSLVNHEFSVSFKTYWFSSTASF